jgi:hypothetical protein
MVPGPFIKITIEFTEILLTICSETSHSQPRHLLCCPAQVLVFLGFNFVDGWFQNVPQFRIAVPPGKMFE